MATGFLVGKQPVENEREKRVFFAGERVGNAGIEGLSGKVFFQEPRVPKIQYQPFHIGNNLFMGIRPGSLAPSVFDRILEHMTALAENAVFLVNHASKVFEASYFHFLPVAVELIHGDVDGHVRFLVVMDICHGKNTSQYSASLMNPTCIIHHSTYYCKKKVLIFQQSFFSNNTVFKVHIIIVSLIILRNYSKFVIPIEQFYEFIHMHSHPFTEF